MREREREKEGGRERSKTYSLVSSELGAGEKSCPVSHQEFVTSGAAGPHCDLKAGEEAMRVILWWELLLTFGDFQQHHKY